MCLPRRRTHYKGQYPPPVGRISDTLGQVIQVLKQIVWTDVDQSSCKEDVEDDEEVEDRLSQPVEPFIPLRNGK